MGINWWTLIILILLNTIIVIKLIDRIKFYLNREYGKGYGNRLKRKYKSFREISPKELKNSNIFEREKEKVIKAGFDEDKGVYVFIFIKYIISVIIGILGMATNYPNIAKGILLFLVIFLSSELTLKIEIRRNNRLFQKNAYKIYKFLNNQVSSGIRISEALKNLYQIIDDYNLKKILIKFSAIYIQTSNIDLALKEFDKYYDTQESESLCICIKQGIATGDSSNLLRRQEELMFNKYINYIQLETDFQKNKSILAVGMLCLILVIMIGVPLFSDMDRALTSIFK